MVPVQAGGNALIAERRQEVVREIQGIQSTIQFFQRKFNECRANVEAQINSESPLARQNIEIMLISEQVGLEGALPRSPSPDLQAPLPEGELHNIYLVHRNLQGVRRQLMKNFLSFVQNSLQQLGQN